MASAISFDGLNSGLQLGENHGQVSVQFLQSQVSLNEACLRDLRTTDPYDDKNRIEETKGGLLSDSYRWILDNDEFKRWQDGHSGRLLWIKGEPGKGKTMLLCGIIDELAGSIPNTANVSFFFCQATDARINTATAVLRGLIYSLVEKRRSLLSYVRSQYDQAGKQIFEDVNAWYAVSRMFTNILKDTTIQDTYLIIDALDECKIGLPSLLNLIVQESSASSSVKWIVSSRNWPEIEEQLGNATQAAPISLELNETSVSEAVNNFIRHKVGQLAKTKRYDDKTCETICRYFSLNSQGTFLWVALVCEELTRISRRQALKKLTEFPPGLHALYGQMIDQIRDLGEDDAKLCMRVLAIVSVVYQPLTLKELKVFLDELNEDFDNDEDLSELIMRCGSFLTQRDKTIRFVHQSAQDFLKTSREIFAEGIEAEHDAIFKSSLQLVFKTLQRDICNIKAPALPAREVRLPNPNPLAAARYSCVYWVDHLQDSRSNKCRDISFDEGGCVDAFLQEKYLNWLETLSILGSLSYGIEAMLKLESLIEEKCGSQALSNRVRDASRFIRYHRAAIESSPLQVYNSSLIFSPAESITKMCYQMERPGWVLNDPLVEKDWSPCLQTLEGHRGSVYSITWSPDGGQLASASSDNTVRIWNPATGQCDSTLEGHRDSVRSICWSQNGSQLASASDDHTVKIWDPVFSRCVSTLEGHSDSVRSISWSPDGGQLASASSDNTVRIWDPATGRCVLTLEGHSDSVRSICWSQNGSQLASASDDHTVTIWNPATGQCVSTLEVDSAVYLIAWSQDGNHLASASSDETVRIWDPAAGQYMLALDGHSGAVYSIAWSQDGSRLASASTDNTIRIWDPATGRCVLTLEGHSDSVRSVCWSQDGSRLASASSDTTIRIWDPVTGRCVFKLDGHSDWVGSVVWSQDGSRLASASFDKTVRIWYPATEQSQPTIEGHSRRITSIAWSRDRRRLASASSDNTIRIWNPATGQCISTLKGHSDWVDSVAWSQNGMRLASVSRDNTIRIWDAITFQCALTLEGSSLLVYLIAWSQDGSRLASASLDKTVRIWDPATGQCASILDGHSEPVHSIAWSQDGSRLASGSLDNTVRIWDLATGQCASTLNGHSEAIHSIAWSQDGSRLASGSLDKTVMIWDPVTGQSILTLQGHGDSVRSICWSKDGMRLASSSLDNTVRIYDLATGQGQSVLHISSPHFLQFDNFDVNHLHTSIGTFNITSMSHSSTSLPEQYGYGLNVDHSWITYNGVNLLWLPAEYRPVSPSLFRISARTIAICCSLRRVIFLTLSEHNPLSGF